jgi:glycosyltransferase involved in cell wall biosynthesis
VPVIRIRGAHTALGQPGIQMRRYRAWLRRGLVEYRSRHGEPDILHAMCAIPAGWACTHLDDPLATRIVVTEHTGPFSLVLSPRAGEAYVRAGLAKAAAVLAVSEPLRQDMLAAGIKREITVVGNPVAEVFAATPPPPVATDSAGRAVYHGLYVGRLTELKGIPELIEAGISLTREVQHAHSEVGMPPHTGMPHRRFSIHWHVAGYGPLDQEWRSRFAAAGLTDSLTLHGFCDKPTVARLLREAHFLVLPSHGENCPLAICEALSFGRPVAATDVPGCAALVGDGDGVLARVKDPKSLATAIETLLTDYHRWDWSAIAARAKERFAPAAVAARYAEVFRKVKGELRM